MSILLSELGIFSMSYGALLGIASYTTSLCLLGGLSYTLSLILSLCTSGIFGIIITLTSFRIKSDYFIAATLALQWIFGDVFVNATSITGGPAGLYGIPFPKLFGIEFSSSKSFLILSLLLLILSMYLLHRVKKSNFGSILRAIKDDEIAVSSLGRNPYLFKSIVIIIASIIAGFAGNLYSTYLGVIEPTAFDLNTSILISVIVIVGGFNFLKIVLSTLILLSFPQLLMYLNVSSSIQGPLYQLLYGVIIVVIILIQAIKNSMVSNKI
jgi:branched-chain amino acid transport system permease protein